MMVCPASLAALRWRPSIPGQPGRSRKALRLAAVVILALPLRAALPSSAELGAVVVTATRAPRTVASLASPVDLFGADAFVNAPALAVDEALKASAAFSLFRRTGSMMAHPTAQGVSLRNLGPSGAGRTLVLLDGVPLNDPFGGWVAWTKVPRLDLAGAEIVRGGGSAAWGSAALGGTIQLLTARSHPADQDAAFRSEAANPFGGTLLAELGAFSTRSGELLAEAGRGKSRVRVAAKSFASDGFWRLAEADRGSIDRPMDQEHHVAQMSWRHRTPSGVTTDVTARYYREDRGNGTPLQRNRTREGFISGRAQGRVTARDIAWSASAYLQTQEFASRFSAVADDRASETPALDQFAVPADAAGAAIVGTWAGAGSAATTTVGSDVRWVRGETREAFLRRDGAFTRHRLAGGEQRFIGAFTQHDRELAPGLRLNLGARADYWWNGEGRRREVEIAAGAPVRDDAFPTRHGWEFSPAAGLVWHPGDSFRARGTAYRAFRVPTLNELYRPFRVGNVITEANEALAVETLEGIEAGIDFLGPRTSLALTGFVNELRDAVANVTLGAGPGTVPGVGFVPAGGLGRQRRNLERVRVRGIEATWRWRAGAAFELRLDYLFSDATVRRPGSPATDLAGRRLAQVPRHTAVAGLAWRDGPWNASTRLRHVSSAFEDDENRQTLAPATTVDIRLARSFGASEAGEISLVAENVFGELIEAGRDADGRLDVGPPRFVHGGIRWKW